MHIEIGILPQAKLAMAAVAASGVLLVHAKPLFGNPVNLFRTSLAAFFFSVLMQLWHMPIGPSELHLVGAMPIYLLFGFLPTLFGFGVGLLLQAVLFEPQDLVHLAVNFLSLAVPLMAVHYTLGKSMRRLTLANVVKLDAVYYAGVTLMVGFWLSVSTDPAPLADWGRFASSYLLLVALEPVLTVCMVLLARRMKPGRFSRLSRLSLDESWVDRVGAGV
ncbi:MAG: energy-coupling factor ABC transporter permease [Lautropia sp.]|nr:energy-coupling factor ABC transporter permease [Lautropia sp.]